MRKLLCFLLFTAPLFGQSVTGTIPSAGGGASCVSVSTDTQGVVGISVTGTWTGTLQPEVAIGNDAPANVQVTPSTSSTAQNTITANGVFSAAVTGSTQFYLCGNTVASGTANVKLNVVKLSSSKGGGAGGSGTVTNTGGALTANAVVLGAGGSDTKVSTGITTNGASELDLGIAAGATGVLGLNGSTSGKATLTAPAVAGTVTNQILFSNNIQVPSGTSNLAALGLGATNTGLTSSGSTPIMIIGGSQITQFTTTGTKNMVGDYQVNSPCAAAGSAANPSIAACGAASAGAFSCATAASTGTCQVNTTVVTATSDIYITQRTDTVTGTRLSVTCNTGVSTVLPVVTAVTAATSFTINLGTITANPECFNYFIVN